MRLVDVGEMLLSGEMPHGSDVVGLPKRPWTPGMQPPIV